MNTFVSKVIKLPAACQWSKNLKKFLYTPFEFDMPALESRSKEIFSIYINIKKIIVQVQLKL